MMMVLQLLYVATVVSAAKYQCMTNLRQITAEEAKQVCDDYEAATWAGAVTGTTRQAGRAEAEETFDGKQFSRSQFQLKNYPDLEPPATLKSFMTRKHPNCVWWKGNLIHRKNFPVEDITTVETDSVTGEETRTFNPVPEWVKTYFFEFQGNTMFVPWEANVTGLMRDDNPQSFWSNWINGRLPEFSRAHDKIVYDILKTSKCQFKAYQTLEEWKSNGPQFYNTEGCNFKYRHWNTICQNDIAKADCFESSWDPSSWDPSSGGSSGGSSSTIDSYNSASWHSIFGDFMQSFSHASGTPRVPTPYVLNGWKEWATLPTGSVKTLIPSTSTDPDTGFRIPGMLDRWFWLTNATLTKSWTGEHEDGTTWTGENSGIWDAIRKHKQLQVGKSRDVFYQDESCGGGGGGNSSAASIILSTLFMMVMLV